MSNVAGILILVDTILAGAKNVAGLTSIYRQMREEGRTELTPSEWAIVQDADDLADSKLAAEVAKAKAEGR